MNVNRMGPQSQAPSTRHLVRQILHVDMDAFFVSVEELEDPSLPIRTAKRLCPQAIFLRGHYERYRDYSERLGKLFHEFTPAVEMVSIDEAYLDLTGCERLHGGAFRAADRLIRAVKEHTGLSCSAGLSTSHVVSKIASDQAKPHGLLYVFGGREAEFLAPLPVRRMPGIGKVTEPELGSLGIFKIGGIRAYGLERLKNHFGKYGEWLHAKALGKDIEAYAYSEEPKSISHETTFDADTDDVEEIERTLFSLAELVAMRLRDHAFFARTVGLKLRFVDFTTLTRDLTLEEPTRLDSVIFEQVLGLFKRAWNGQRKIRLLGVRTSNFESSSFQLGLIEAEKTAKLTRALEAADRLRKRYGFETMRLARGLDPPSAEARKSPPRRRFFGRED
ncbi:MAG: DNA polymerase IV [Acidobacteria bacterium]|nr:MAG: DNA polymerase IV [Acidobacteriota bacterium]